MDNLLVILLCQLGEDMVVKIPEGDVPVKWHQDPPYLKKDWDKLTTNSQY